MGKARVIQQAPERLDADGSLPYVLVTVEFRSTLSLGVVAVPDTHRVKADRRADLLLMVAS